MTDRPNKPVRIAADLVEKLSWLVEFGDESMGEILDPLIRKHIERRYDRIANAVEVIKAAKANVQPAAV